MAGALAIVALALAAVPVMAGGQLADEADRREAIRHYRIGQDLLYREHWDEAAEAFQKAIELEPLLTLAHYGLGQARMGAKAYPAAVRAYTNCREAFRRLHQLAASDRLSAERLRDDEIRELRDSLSLIQSGTFKSINPITVQRIQDRLRDLEHRRQRTNMGEAFQPPPEVSLALGSAYFRSGALPEAEREYRAAIDVDPKMGEAHNNLAVVMFLTGRLEEAEREVALAKKARFRVDARFERDLEEASRRASTPK